MSGTREKHPYTIRYATEQDVSVILQIINELAAYERALHDVLATESRLRSTLSFPDPSSSTGFTEGYAKTLLITPKEGSQVAGMALFFHNYSTWHAAPGIYLEDLFVREQYRRRGYGSALLRRLAKEAIDVGGKRLEWSVLKWNEPSIRFYESADGGAKMMSEWAGMRVEGEGLGRLASKDRGEGVEGMAEELSSRETGAMDSGLSSGSWVKG